MKFYKQYSSNCKLRNNIITGYFVESRFMIDSLPKTIHRLGAQVSPSFIICDRMILLLDERNDKIL